ncbi:hypothetical protein ACFVOK_33010 [Streptomyces sp. NPDC057798]
MTAPVLLLFGVGPQMSSVTVRVAAEADRALAAGARGPHAP